jgi:hypothetical protein
MPATLKRTAPMLKHSLRVLLSFLTLGCVSHAGVFYTSVTLTPPLGLTDMAAKAINNSGQILVTGYCDGLSGPYCAYILWKRQLGSDCRRQLYLGQRDE